MAVPQRWEPLVIFSRVSANRLCFARATDFIICPGADFDRRPQPVKIKASIRHAILWAAAILASALLHGPLTLTLILVSLACGAVATDDEHVARGDCRRS